MNAWMIFSLGLTLGLMVGGSIGVVAWALLSANGNDDGEGVDG